MIEERLGLADNREAQILKIHLDALRLDATLAQQQFEIDRVDALEQLADELQRKLDLIRNDDSGKHTEIPESTRPDRVAGPLLQSL